MHVLVIGYYFRNNLGDDVFARVISEYLLSRNCIPIVKNIDDLVIIPEDISCVIFGGGDLINDYFI